MVILNSTPGVKRTYVDAQIKTVNDKIGTTPYTGDTLTAAIAALQASVGADGEVGKKVTQLTNALGYTSADFTETGTLAEGVKSIDTRLDALEATVDTATTGLTARVGAIETSLTEAGTVGAKIKANADAIDAINNETTGILATAEGYTDAQIGTMKAYNGETGEAIPSTVVGMIDSLNTKLSNAISASSTEITEATVAPIQVNKTGSGTSADPYKYNLGLKDISAANEATGAVTAGTSIVVPVVTTDAYGRVTALSTATANISTTVKAGTDLVTAGAVNDKIGTLSEGNATVVAEIAAAETAAEDYTNGLLGDGFSTTDTVTAKMNAIAVKGTGTGVEALASGAVKEYVDAKVSGAVASAYVYKGSVATYDALPSDTTTLTAGDVYNVVAANGNTPAGTNYAWTGSAWDALGGTNDLSAYATIENVNTALGNISSDLTHLDGAIEAVDAGSEKKHISTTFSLPASEKGTGSGTCADSTVDSTAMDVIIEFDSAVAAYEAGIEVTGISSAVVTFTCDYAFDKAITGKIIALQGATDAHAAHAEGAFPTAGGKSIA